MIPTPAPVPPIAVNTRELPSVLMRIDVGPDLLAVGDTATITLTLTNQSALPASGVDVTLTLPDGAVASTKDGRLKQNAGWAWPGLSIAVGATVTQVLKAQINRMPPGEALLLRARMTLPSAPNAVQITGGAVVVDRNQAPTTARFTPGKKDKLQVNAARITVDLPPGLAAKALTVTHIPQAQVKQARKDKKQAPLTKRRLQRSLGAFELLATDDAGNDVHQFTEPLTITVGYTPEQLDALNIAQGDLQLTYYDEATSAWVPVPSTVNPQAKTVQARVDHFTPWQLSDGNSPSSAFVPSLQGFQTSLFTGAASYNYPIAVPAGAGGLKPDVALSYSSAATDGPGGTRQKAQSSWAGKGWTLQTGYVARNKINMGATTVSYFSLVFSGRSYDLVGTPLVGNADPNKPTDWSWRATDEAFLKIQVVEQGDSYNGRGGYSWGTPLKRHLWQVWTKDGTRYDFAEDAWWGWQGDRMEAYKWMLSKVTDTHDNVISYTYGRAANNLTNGQQPVNGTLDWDVYPVQIQWGGNARTGAIARYALNFESRSRGSGEDDQFEGADNQYPGPNAAPHETRVLTGLSLWSYTTGWNRIKQWKLVVNTALGLYSDRTANGGGADTGYPKLALYSIQVFGVDGSWQLGTGETALPPTIFSYNTNYGGGGVPSGGWNRLTQIDNGQGGVVTIAYENIAASLGGNFNNRHRVTSRTLRDTTTGASYTWSYTYSQYANLNTLGTGYGGQGTTWNPTSAVLYYNEKRESWRPGANQGWLLHKPGSEFRGHDWVNEYAPDGSMTQHWFYQGDADCGSPTATNSDAAIWNDPCFQEVRNREILKGREFRTLVYANGGSALLRETKHTFVVPTVDYTATPLTGLWRSYSYENSTIDLTYEGSGSARTHSTNVIYDTTTGNQTEAAEYDTNGALVRKTNWYYLTRNDAGGYILDRRWGETVRDGAGNLLKLTHWFYDQTTNPTWGPNRGELWMTRAYSNVQPTCCANQTVLGSDTTYGYDEYGNQTRVATYAGYGQIYNAWYSAPGNGSAARLTTTTYDPTFHAFPIQQTNPLGQAEYADYDYRFATLTRVTDLNGQNTYAGYDTLGRLKSLQRPGDSSPSITNYYYDSERPFRFLRAQLRSNDPGGDAQSESQQFYDGLGRLIQTKQESLGWGQQNIVADTRFDGFGKAVAQSQPRYVNESPGSFGVYTNPGGSLYRATTTTYDALGRVRIVTNPDTTRTDTQYWLGSLGTVVATYDANNHLTTSETDTLGRRRTIGEYRGNNSSEGGYALDATTSYAYDALDRLITTTDAKGNVTTLSYDSLGRKVGMNDPDMGQWWYDYLPSGGLNSQMDAKGQRTAFSYDALDRLTRTMRADGSRDDFFYDDQGAQTAGYNYGRGHRTSMQTVAANGVVELFQRWEYDLRGRESFSGSNTNITGAHHILTTYDNADQIMTRKYQPTDEVVTYTYDMAGRPYTLCSSYGPCYITGATYTALGQPLARWDGGGAFQGWTYQTLTGRTENTQVWARGSVYVFGRNYWYDNAGNVAGIGAWENGSGVTPRQVQAFSYDQRDRLIASSTSGDSVGAYNETYQYDTLGNLTQKGTVPQRYGSTWAGTGNGPHRLAANLVNGSWQGYGYDNNGNMYTGNGRNYTWDAANRPVAITGPDSVTETYRYDGDGNRITRTRQGQTTVYFQGLWEDTLGVNGRKLYRFNGQIVAIRDGAGAVTYPHGDHLGSVSVVTDGNGNLAPNGKQEFDPWGSVRAGGITSTTLNFTGQRRDDTGLLFYNARYYDPQIGRFVSADSVVPGNASGGMNGVALRPLTVDFHEGGLLGGLNSEGAHADKLDWGGPADPQGLNRYSYVRNNPMGANDPSGHSLYLTNADARALVDSLNQTALEIGSGSAIVGGITELMERIISKADLAGRALSSESQTFYRAIVAGSVEAMAAGAIFGGGVMAGFAGSVSYAISQLSSIIDARNGNNGVAIAVEDGSVLVADRESGKAVSWMPGLSPGANYIVSNMPKSWQFGSKPLGDPNWRKNYHFRQDDVCFR